MEHERTTVENTTSDSVVPKLCTKVSLRFQQMWDAICPLFLQRFVFSPQWNCRDQDSLMRNVAFWRSKDRREYQNTFHATTGRGLFLDRNGFVDLGDESLFRKLLLGIAVGLTSFSASSPHFFLNALTVFSCSMSLGLSVSLTSMDTCRSGVTTTTFFSAIKAQNLVTTVFAGQLIGQLVGSSGGVLFLAEFIVTSISLVLGGAGTISATAMESWFTFFCLSVTSFWAYLFGRVAILESFRQRKNGFSSIMLRISLASLFVFFVVSLWFWSWETAAELMLVRPLETTSLEISPVADIYNPVDLP